MMDIIVFPEVLFILNIIMKCWIFLLTETSHKQSKDLSRTAIATELRLDVSEQDQL